MIIAQIETVELGAKERERSGGGALALVVVRAKGEETHRVFGAERVADARLVVPVIQLGRRVEHGEQRGGVRVAPCEQELAAMISERSLDQGACVVKADVVLAM